MKFRRDLSEFPITQNCTIEIPLGYTQLCPKPPLRAKEGTALEDRVQPDTFDCVGDTRVWSLQWTHSKSTTHKAARTAPNGGLPVGRAGPAALSGSLPPVSSCSQGRRHSRAARKGGSRERKAMTAEAKCGTSMKVIKLPDSWRHATLATRSGRLPLARLLHRAPDCEQVLSRPTRTRLRLPRRRSGTCDVIVAPQRLASHRHQNPRSPPGGTFGVSFRFSIS